VTTLWVNFPLRNSQPGQLLYAGCLWRTAQLQLKYAGCGAIQVL